MAKENYFAEIFTDLVEQKIWESFISWIICIPLWSEALEFTSVN